MKKIMSGFSAGVLISIGGAVYLACDNKYCGAVLFSVALLCICIKGYFLFTGKVGYLAEKCGKEDVSIVLSALAGNFCATVICGLLIRYALPASAATAEAMAVSKLAQTFPQTLIRSFFCGVLMYLAVSIYRDKNTIAGIVFCVPVFILAGFEHSIADMFYLAAAGAFTLPALGFIVTVLIGNSLGGLLLPAIAKVK